MLGQRFLDLSRWSLGAIFFGTAVLFVNRAFAGPLQALQPEHYDIASTLVVMIGAYAASGIILELGARAGYAKGPTRVGRWSIACMRRHPSCEVRLRAHLVLLDAAWRSDGVDEVIDSLRAQLPAAREAFVCPWSAINLLVDRLVAAGRYQEALEVSSGWSEKARARGRFFAPFPEALVRINRAEALHNLGRDEEALEGVRGVLEDHPEHAFVQTGGGLLEAWILASRGDRRALEIMQDVDPKPIGTRYRAEYHFTYAAALAIGGGLAHAEKHARKGIEVAERPSSLRNGWFLLGSIAFLRGDAEQALAHFETGLSLRYRGQGGAALLLRARAVTAIGGDVRAALELVVERDPQSFAAARARRELAALADSQ